VRFRAGATLAEAARQ